MGPPALVVLGVGPERSIEMPPTEDEGPVGLRRLKLRAIRGIGPEILSVAKVQRSGLVDGHGETLRRTTRRGGLPETPIAFRPARWHVVAEGG